MAASALIAAALSGQLEVAIWLAPLSLLALPLARGRYVGERKIERLRAGGEPRRVAPRLSLLPGRRRSFRPFPRGGRLIGHALAVRPPPVLLVP
jgi:hypothetical protein